MNVEIVEVSPRDGLQNEKALLTTDAKVELIRSLLASGARRIEAVSFVHPGLVPAMADAEEVMERVPREPGASYSGLVLNRRGWERARDAGVDEINVVISASDTFSRRNQNSGMEESMASAEEVVADAKAHGTFTTVTLATAFGCPFEGEIDRDIVVELGVRAVNAGADELSIADTIGVGVPTQVRALIGSLKEAMKAPPVFRVHLHNTRNTGFANAVAAVECGVAVLDASAGGIGGCPFAPSATGNIASEDLVYLLHRMGHRTGYNLSASLRTTHYLSDMLGYTVPALLPKAGTFPN